MPLYSHRLTAPKSLPDFLLMPIRGSILNPWCIIPNNLGVIQFGQCTNFTYHFILVRLPANEYVKSWDNNYSEAIKYTVLATYNSLLWQLDHLDCIFCVVKFILDTVNHSKSSHSQMFYYFVLCLQPRNTDITLKNCPLTYRPYKCTVPAWIYRVLEMGRGFLLVSNNNLPR